MHRLMIWMVSNDTIERMHGWRWDLQKKLGKTWTSTVLFIVLQWLVSSRWPYQGGCCRLLDHTQTLMYSRADLHIGRRNVPCMFCLCCVHQNKEHPVGLVGRIHLPRFHANTFKLKSNATRDHSCRRQGTAPCMRCDFDKAFDRYRDLKRTSHVLIW